MKNRYQAVIRPVGYPLDIVLSHLEGRTHQERAHEIRMYLFEIGVVEFVVTHYAPIVIKNFVIEDINLN